MDRAEKILVKELRNREDFIKHVAVRVDELSLIQKLIRDARRHLGATDGALALQRAETIFNDGLRDWYDDKPWWTNNYAASITLSELRAVHELVLEARKSSGAPAV